MAIDLGEIFSLLEQVAGYEQNIQSAQAQAAQQATLNTVFSQDSAVLSLLQQVNATLIAGLTTVESVLNIVIQNEQQLQTAITGLQKAGQPVTLPPTAPPTYGGPSGSQVGSDVWSFQAGGADRPMGDFLIDAGLLAINLGGDKVGFRSPANPYIIASSVWHEPQEQVRSEDWPSPAANNIRPTDTLLTWLERETGITSWGDNGSGYFFTIDPNPPNFLEFWCTLSEWEFDILKLKGAGGSGAAVAPIWPGSAKVTLGTTTAHAGNATVIGPFSGLIIAITVVPSTTLFFTYGSPGVLSYRHIGAVAFVDDHGEAEHQQAIGFHQAVYAPKAMALAQSCLIMAPSTVQYTVTPWTVI